MVEAITLCEAKNLDVGQTVYAIGYYDIDGTAQKFIVQEKPKVWKRNADRVEITLKRGLKELVTLTELCLDEFSLEEPERLEKLKKVESLSEDFEPLIQVACKVLECEPEQVREEKYGTYGLKVFSGNGMEYAIGKDDEATEATKNYIKDNAWTFKPEFVASHTKGGASNGMIKAITALQEACESCNDDILSLIDDIDDFIEEAVSSDGRGMFLSPYDSNEQEVKIGDEYYYAYRQN